MPSNQGTKYQNNSKKLGKSESTRHNPSVGMLPNVVNPDFGHISLFQQLTEGPAPKIVTAQNFSFV